jgi:hypothetical protein
MRSWVLLAGAVVVFAACGGSGDTITTDNPPHNNAATPSRAGTRVAETSAAQGGAPGRAAEASGASPQ